MPFVTVDSLEPKASYLQRMYYYFFSVTGLSLIQALEMKCFRKLFGISYRDHITNEEVRARIGNAIGPYNGLLTSVK